MVGFILMLLMPPSMVYFGWKYRHNSTGKSLLGSGALLSLGLFITVFAACTGHH